MYLILTMYFFICMSSTRLTIAPSHGVTVANNSGKMLGIVSNLNIKCSRALLLAGISREVAWSPVDLGPWRHWHSSQSHNTASGLLFANSTEARFILYSSQSCLAWCAFCGSVSSSRVTFTTLNCSTLCAYFVSPLSSLWRIFIFVLVFHSLIPFTWTVREFLFFTYTFVCWLVRKSILRNNVFNQHFYQRDSQNHVALSICLNYRDIIVFYLKALKH